MPNKIRQFVFMLILLAGCYQTAPTSDQPTATPLRLPNPRPPQTVIIDGSAIVARLMQNEATGFQSFTPGYTIKINQSGTRDGFALFCQDQTDIQNALREMNPDEASECLRNGVNYLKITVGYDALAIVGNAPIGDCISSSELTLIYTHDNLTWSDMRKGVSPELVKVFSPPPETGEAQFFTEQVITSQRPVHTTNIQTLIASGSDGLGYMSLLAARKLGSRVKVYAVDSGGGCTLPTEASIWDGSYSFLSRPLYIYMNRQSIRRSEVFRFLTYVFSNLGQQRINDAEFITAPPTVYEAAQTDIDAIYRQGP